MSRFGINKNPSEVATAIAGKLKSLRKELRFSQAELAERSGVSLGSLKRFESSGRISLEALLKLAQIVNRLEDFDLLLNPSGNLDAIEKLFSNKTRK